MRNGKQWLSALVMMVFLTCFTVGTAQAQISGQVPDLSSWVNTWFKLTLSRTVYHFSDIGVKPTPSTPTTEPIGIAYMKITDWVLDTGPMTANIYTKDLLSGEWDPTPLTTLTIQYFAGSDLKFAGTSQLAVGGITLDFIFYFTGKKDLAGNFILGGITNVKTLGGFILEIDDVPGSDERWVGSAKLTGPMVPESKVPAILRGL